jgi:hypothetical protein
MDEKVSVDQIADERASPTTSGPKSSSELDDFDYTPEEQRAIIRRVDFRLVTTVGLMYCCSLMDRTNLGSAVIAGMGAELVLIDYRYVSSSPPRWKQLTLTVRMPC